MTTIEKTTHLLYSVQDDKAVPMVITQNLVDIAEYWEVEWINREPKDVIQDIWIKFDIFTK